MKKLVMITFAIASALMLGSCKKNTGAELKIAAVYGAPHGDKSSAVAVAVVAGEKIVDAYIDEFQFMSKDIPGIKGVPNSDKDFGKSYADGMILCSKREITDIYSANMTRAAKATIAIDKNLDAIQNKVKGMTISEVEALSQKEKAADAISGCTLVDAGNYAALIVAAAKNAAASTESYAFDGNLNDVKLNLAYGAAHGTKCFTMAASAVADGKILLCWIDDFQFMAPGEGVKALPNSDKSFGKGYAEGQVLCSKREIADLYSENMTKKAKATIAIDKNFDAIQKKLSGMTVADAEKLSENEKAVDAVSGCTLVDTRTYVGVVVDASK